MTKAQFHSFRSIDAPDERIAAFRLFKENLHKDAQVFPDHLIGWQGGSRRHTAYWLPRVMLWAVLEPSPPGIKKGRRQRFWNCFGTDNPAQRHMLPITVEINMPQEGEDRRVAGLFALDGEGRVYVAHTGKVGGGRKGIGAKAFRNFVGDDPWHEIDTSSGKLMAIVLGPVDAPDFAKQLADFVHNVAIFKESATK
jgi:5-methylcytosine-specific restriction enzyme A